MKEIPEYLGEERLAYCYSDLSKKKNNKEKCRSVKCLRCGNLFFVRVLDIEYPGGKKGRYCSRTCVAKHTLTGRKMSEKQRVEMSLARRNEGNPAWKGDSVGWDGGHDRAQRWYKLEPCEKCGSEKSERHHRDSDFRNNNRDNIQFLCRYHHMEIDGRLHKPKRGVI